MMAVVYGYLAHLADAHSTHIWARDDEDADRQAIRIGGVLSLERDGVELQLADPGIVTEEVEPWRP